MRQDPDHHLEQHEGDDEDERDSQVTPIRVCADPVRVRVITGIVVVIVAIVLMMGVIVGHWANYTAETAWRAPARCDYRQSK